MNKFFLLLFITAFAFLSNLPFEKKYKSFAEKNFFKKVYLHTDKTVYFSGEKIWFKAYVFDAKQNRLDTSSHILFVELIDPARKIVVAKNVRLFKGIGMGQISLPDSFFSGYYQLRAYTNVMKNYPSEFFYHKTVFINTPNKKITPGLWREIKKVRRKQKKVFVSFYFEGTGFLKNSENKILVRIYDFLNEPLKVENLKVKVSGNKEYPFENQEITSGFYALSFNPARNKKFYLEFVHKGKKYKFAFPKPSDRGIALDFSEQKDDYLFEFRPVNFILKGVEKSLVYVFGEQNGNLVYVNSLDLTKDSLLKINRKTLPAGITHFIFMKPDGKVLFERLLYKKPENQLNLTLDFNRSKNVLNLEIKSSNKADLANLSLAVVSPGCKNDNIVDYYYLLSDLGLEQSRLSELPEEKINHCLLAYKWKKYGTEQIMSDTIYLKYRPLYNLTISGYIANILEGIPARAAKVKLIILDKYNDYFMTKTDNSGKFKFTIDYQDTVSFLIEARTKRNKKNVIVFLDSYDTVDIAFLPVKNPFLPFYTYKNVLPKKIGRYKTSPGTLHQRADQVIYFDDIETTGYTNVLDILKGRVAGYNQVNDQVHFRGYHSFNLSSEPLYLIDNIPVDVSAVESLNPDVVDRVEIIRSATAIYGSRGANGVIAIYTKQGYNIVWGKYEGKFSGYSVAEKFKPVKTGNPCKTYLWKPFIQLVNGRAYLQINLKDLPDTCSFVLQGAAYDGRVGFCQKNFTLAAK